MSRCAFWTQSCAQPGVNLFEKVKIPETQENIRRISIYLADQQVNAVVRSKIAKRKIAARSGPAPERQVAAQ